MHNNGQHMLGCEVSGDHVRSRICQGDDCCSQHGKKTKRCFAQPSLSLPQQPSLYLQTMP